MLNRIGKLRKILPKLDLDGFLVTDQYNISYLTGFIGLSPGEREAFLFITKKNAYLLTFPTYYGLYKERTDFFLLQITRSLKLSDHLNQIIAKEKIKSVGFESENLTLSEFSSLKRKLKVNLKKKEKVVENQRIIKDEEEIVKIRAAAKITDEAFDFIKRKIKKGISEKELAQELEFFLKKKADDIAFPPIVAFSQNAAIPHYLPSNNQQLTINNLILLDFGAKVDGYCSDLTRILFLGQPEKEQIRVYQDVLAAQELSLKKLKVGIKSASLDDFVRKFLIAKGYGNSLLHGLGHGVGLSIHEAPRLRKDSKEVLKENMVFTLEPGIYLEGKYGIRIEDLVVLKKDGIEILSKSPKLLKELIIL